jgi:DNA-directed RNA polymerase subunit RPC12/RpoP
MADSIKCPNCNANLVFDADRQLMVCEYCMSSFTAEQLKNSIVPEAPEDSDAGERIHEKDAAEHIKQGLGDQGVQFICNACGAQVVTDAHTSATFCAFCGSPAIISQRLSEEFSPDFILPFKYGKEEAVKKFFKWCKGGRWTPFDFVSKKNVEKLTGLYVPFWLYDVDSDVDLAGEGVHEVSHSTGNTTTVTTSYYNVRRRSFLSWKHIPLDGSTRIDDRLMEAIEPFNFKQMKDFDPAYMQGFFAERFDQTGDDLKGRLVGRVKEYITEEMAPSLKKYNKGFKVKKDNSLIYEPKMFYALMPVWFLHYNYNGKDYDFCMNGSTGEVAGIPPVSRLKRIVLFFVILAIAAVLTRLIVGMIMGGFVG